MRPPECPHHLRNAWLLSLAPAHHHLNRDVVVGGADDGAPELEEHFQGVRVVASRRNLHIALEEGLRPPVQGVSDVAVELEARPVKGALERGRLVVPDIDGLGYSLLTT